MFIRLPQKTGADIGVNTDSIVTMVPVNATETTIFLNVKASDGQNIPIGVSMGMDELIAAFNA